MEMDPSLPLFLLLWNNILQVKCKQLPVLKIKQRRYLTKSVFPCSCINDA